MSNLVERLRGDLMTPYQATQLMDEAAARIEQLEAALREIAKHPRGGVIDAPEKIDRDEFIGLARAAMDAHSIDHKDGL